MIKVEPAWSEVGTIRAKIIYSKPEEKIFGNLGIKHSDTFSLDLTMLEALQLQEGLEDWIKKVKNREIQNK
jgi:hypothetical protein